MHNHFLFTVFLIDFYVLFNVKCLWLCVGIVVVVVVAVVVVAVVVVEQAGSEPRY